MNRRTDHREGADAAGDEPTDDATRSPADDQSVTPDDAASWRDGESAPALTCEAVGVVHTPFDRPEEAPRQGMRAAARGELQVDPAYEEALAGVESGDDLEVYWYADRADRSVLSVDGHGMHPEPRGVFVSRSQDRPTPVCVTRVRVLSVEGTRLLLEGVDMLDGTPVLDLKTPLVYDE